MELVAPAWPSTCPSSGTPFALFCCSRSTAPMLAFCADDLVHHTGVTTAGKLLPSVQPFSPFLPHRTSMLSDN